LLWLPLRRVLQNTNEIRRAWDLPPVTAGQFASVRRFGDTCEKLVRTLQKLAEAKRACFGQWESADDELRRRGLEAGKELPLWVDLSYVYVRRIVDDFARAAKYVLFRKWGSAPEKFEALRSHLEDPRKLEKLEPVCEIGTITDALASAADLATLITDSTDLEGRTTRKAIRNRLEHHAVVPQVQGSRMTGGPFTTHVYLMGANPGDVTDLTAMLPQAISDLSRIFTVACRTLAFSSDYVPWICPSGDCAFNTGNSVDLTEFWPRIGK
jgi:hypothetical protein